MARLMISLLGPFQVLLGGHVVRGLHSAPLRGLLSFLALESERDHTRRSLADLLWPEQTERVASSNLRYTLSDLRYAIGDAFRDTPGSPARQTPTPFLLVTRETIRINPEADYWIDLREFEWLSGLADGREDLAGECERLEAAAGLYRGPLLEGLSYPDSAEFENWVLWNREHFQRRMIQVLQRLGVCFEAAGRNRAALATARRQVQLEPLDEEGHRRLMRSLARCGQRNAALAHYEQWRTTLAHELDAAPMRETMALYEAIRAGSLTAPVDDRPEPTRPLKASTPPVSSGKALRDGEARPDRYDPGRTAAPLTAQFSPFVARQAELTDLNRSLAEMLQGRGHVVFVTGDAGSGKTTLVREFVQRAVEASPELVAANGSCNAATSTGDPYLPFREILQLLSGDIETQRASGAIGAELARRFWVLLPHVAQALVEQGPGLIDRFVPSAGLLVRVDSVLLGRSANASWRRRLATLGQRLPERDARQDAAPPDVCEQVARVLFEVSRYAPLILVLDDLQWLDNASSDLLFHLGRHMDGRRILVVGIYRSPDVALGRGDGRHPLLSVINELQRVSGRAHIDLARAEGRSFVDAFLDSEPNRFSPGFRDILYAHTGGHALFTVESVRGLRERGEILRDAGGAWVEGPRLDWSQAPPRVEAVVAERLGRLTDECQALLSAASVEGEEFAAEVAAQVAGMNRTDALRVLGGTLGKQHRLVYASKVVWLEERNASLLRYRFQHALFQEYLYQHLDPGERARLHELTAVALEQLYAGHTADIAMQLARHFELAGRPGKAADYWLEAGQLAMRLLAYREAQSDFGRSLELLAQLPQTPDCALRQLRARLAHAWSSSMLGGWGDASRASAAVSAIALSEQAGGLANIAFALLLQAIVQISHGEFVRAREAGEQLLNVAQASGDRQATMLAHYSLGVGALFGGEPLRARAYLEAGLHLYCDDEDGDLSPEILGDVKAGFLFFLGLCLWILGFPEQAERSAREGVERAHQADQSLLLGTLLGACIDWGILARAHQDAYERIGELLRLVDDRKLEPLRALAEFGAGWLLVQQGGLADGLARMMRAAETYRGGSTPVGGVFQLAAIALTALEAGQYKEGLAAVEQAGPWLISGIGRLFEGELQRLGGELLLQCKDEGRLQSSASVAAAEQAEACFRAALEMNSTRGLRMFELRAVTSLARLWQRQGHTDEARQVLAGVYDWFTEGFAGPDLQDARRLLAELR